MKEEEVEEDLFLGTSKTITLDFFLVSLSAQIARVGTAIPFQTKIFCKKKKKSCVKNPGINHGRSFSLFAMEVGIKGSLKKQTATF